MAERKPVKRRSMGGLLAIVILGVVVAAPLVLQSNMGGTAQAQQMQPMELRGHWLGMGLTPASSTTAQQLGVPVGITGVVVAELPNPGGSRAAQGGLQLGDVIVRVDGSSVTDLATLYTLSTRLDVGRPLSLEILRAGQPMVVTLPGPPPGAPQVASPAGAPPGVAGPVLAPGAAPQSGPVGATAPGAMAPGAAATPVASPAAPAMNPAAPLAGAAPGWAAPAAPQAASPGLGW